MSISDPLAKLRFITSLGFLKALAYHWVIDYSRWEEGSFQSLLLKLFFLNIKVDDSWVRE